MERLRTLSEAECYAALLRVAVHRGRREGAPERHDTAAAAGGRGRAAPRSARAPARRARRRSRLTDSAVPDVLGPGVRVVFCGINPGRVSSAAPAPLREPAQRLLASAARRRVHASPARAAGAVRAAALRHRPDECGLPDDARVGRPARGRLRGCARAARGDRDRRSLRARIGVRRQGRVSRASSGNAPSMACRSERFGATRAVRRSPRHRRERRRALGRAAALVRRAPRAGGADSAAVAVRDRRPPVAAEGLRPQLHAGRRLAPLVLGAVDERDGTLDHLGGRTPARSSSRERSSST